MQQSALSLSERFLWFFITALFGLLFLLGLEVLKMFIHSKPPGRKLVGLKQNSSSKKKTVFKNMVSLKLNNVFSTNHGFPLGNNVVSTKTWFS